MFTKYVAKMYATVYLSTNLIISFIPHLKLVSISF